MKRTSRASRGLTLRCSAERASKTCSIRAITSARRQPPRRTFDQGKRSALTSSLLPACKSRMSRRYVVRRSRISRIFSLPPPNSSAAAKSGAISLVERRIDPFQQLRLPSQRFFRADVESLLQAACGQAMLQCAQCRRTAVIQQEPLHDVLGQRGEMKLLTAGQYGRKHRSRFCRDRMISALPGGSSSVFSRAFPEDGLRRSASSMMQAFRVPRRGVGLIPAGAA